VLRTPMLSIRTWSRRRCAMRVCSTLGSHHRILSSRLGPGDSYRRQARCHVFLISTLCLLSSGWMYDHIGANWAGVRICTWHRRRESRHSWRIGFFCVDGRESGGTGETQGLTRSRGHQGLGTWRLRACRKINVGRLSRAYLTRALRTHPTPPHAP
jgi:hypothetical protein